MPVAPVTVDSEGATREADVQAFGRLMIEMLEGVKGSC